MTDFAHPEALVSTDWVDELKDEEDIVVVEVDVDTTAYSEGHIPGAIAWNWKTQLCDQLQRDILSGPQLESLLSESGIGNDTMVILYGDNNNWFAAWAFWQLKIYGHENVMLMNGGRKKWVKDGRPLTTHIPIRATTTYRAKAPDNSIRASLADISALSPALRVELVDVRSPQEFTGEILAPEGSPEACQRGGHIPGASNVPWAVAVNEDGTFKDYQTLKSIYSEADISFKKPIITYCLIGERSSHSWFVLKYLLGHEDIKNYDGSWAEWGNLVGAPIER
jgi:thiosulfate/3-mercaptopyruvate sulfurtransferase